jgi:hypothetical protein
MQILIIIIQLMTWLLLPRYLFFWVARMIMAGHEFSKQVPLTTYTLPVLLEISWAVKCLNRWVIRLIRLI